ncbi:MAG: hypothetical protein Q4E28_04025 [Clostridia bacterium]|nr:hypothetical protein [Clostridia bacterium]
MTEIIVVLFQIRKVAIIKLLSIHQIIMNGLRRVKMAGKILEKTEENMAE